MNPQKINESNRNELIAVANAMLNGETNLIEGVRKICSLRHSLGDPENDVFMPIRAIESETDHFPIGELRKQCANDYLQRVDNEMQRYLAEAKEDIFTACQEIIQVFS